MAAGRPAAGQLIFPGHKGSHWTKTTWDNWRERTFARLLATVGLAGAVNARSAFVSSLSGSNTRNRWLSVRARSRRWSPGSRTRWALEKSAPCSATALPSGVEGCRLVSREGQCRPGDDSAAGELLLGSRVSDHAPCCSPGRSGYRVLVAALPFRRFPGRSPVVAEYIVRLGFRSGVASTRVSGGTARGGTTAASAEYSIVSRGRRWRVPWPAGSSAGAVRRRRVPRGVRRLPRPRSGRPGRGPRDRRR